MNLLSCSVFELSGSDNSRKIHFISNIKGESMLDLRDFLMIFWKCRVRCYFRMHNRYSLLKYIINIRDPNNVVATLKENHLCK